MRRCVRAGGGPTNGNKAPESVCKDRGLLLALAGGVVVGTCQGDVAEVLDAIRSVHTIRRSQGGSLMPKTRLLIPGPTVDPSP
jgi:hypothetical protein